MSNVILKNGISILRCANWATADFFNNFSLVIQETGLQDNSIMIEFLEQLDQEMQGRGLVMVDISDFFDNSENKLPLSSFYDLACKAVEKIKQKDYDEFQVGYFKLLNEFIVKILD